jgi:hypothetical protein
MLLRAAELAGDRRGVLQVGCGERGGAALRHCVTFNRVSCEKL